MSRFARSLMGSDFCHRYAEGHPGERYYQGTDKIDEIEVELKKELKQLFHCQHTEVRPISGTVANEAVFSRYINYGDIVISNSTPGGGNEVSRKLRQNDIILNMNLLPGEPLKNHDNPSGARIGVQEMTRVGMKEQEMDEIAQLIAACLMDDKKVRDDVHKLRAKFQDVKYSFDDVKKPPPAG